jgi:carbon monoxide dehydrogenase subunit G
VVRYRREIEVAGEPGDVFAYLADFEHAAEWDPGIVEARRLSEGPTRVGSRFEVIALFRGNRQRFEYAVTAFEEGRRVALRGEGEKALSDDEITVAPGAGGGTRVAYEADLRLKGAYRIAEPLLGSTFRRMGDEALDGLRARLGDPARPA